MLTLHGLMGPIEVKGKKYPGLVPMTPFKGLSDEDIAAGLTYVRGSFGNQAGASTPDKVADAILKGIYKNRYLVYSSNDIRFGYWWARKFAPPYEFVLQKANDQFSKLL